MSENRGLNLHASEFAEEFREIYDDCMAALPDEEAPEGRLRIEQLRRKANRAAAEGGGVGLQDLT